MGTSQRLAPSWSVTILGCPYPYLLALTMFVYPDLAPSLQRSPPPSSFPASPGTSLDSSPQAVFFISSHGVPSSDSPYGHLAGSQ